MPDTVYRDIRAVLQTAEQVQRHLSSAILANDTSTMSTESAAAQALTDDVLRALKVLVDSGNTGDTHTDMVLVQSAFACMNDAWNDEEKVALEGDVSGVRGRALTARTAVDYGVAYLRASLGHQEGTR